MRPRDAKVASVAGGEEAAAGGVEVEVEGVEGEVGTVGAM